LGGSGLVLVWWLAWILGGIIGVVLVRLPAPETLDALSGWFMLNVLVDAFSIVAAILAILVIRRVQAHADERAISRTPSTEQPAPTGAA
jgi:uncharacterized protein DUF4328